MRARNVVWLFAFDFQLEQPVRLSRIGHVDLERRLLEIVVKVLEPIGGIESRVDRQHLFHLSEQDHVRTRGHAVPLVVRRELKAAVLGIAIRIRILMSQCGGGSRNKYQWLSVAVSGIVYRPFA